MSARPESAIARIEQHDEVAVIVVDSPPVNALSHSVRVALIEMCQWADAQADVAAIVIRCDGRTFFAGADIREFSAPLMKPKLPDVVNAIEACETPVIAAIHGTALGGGLEVAMACRYRVALSSAKLGLPEVKLGILPGAGGTQRLPRIVPMEPALEMMTTGAPITAPEAAAMGLVDEMVDGDLPGAAIAAARRIAAAPVKPPRTRDRTDRLAEAKKDPGVYDRFLQANARRFRGFAAPPVIVEAARAAVDAASFEAGQAEERRLFEKLASGPQPPAMRHVFFAEREAAKVPGLDPAAAIRPVDKIGIIGAGTMGSGIAIAFLNAGLPVTLVETGQEALDRGVGLIRTTIERQVTNGRIAPDAGARAIGMLTATLDFEALADVDLVVEAAYEDMAVKREIFARIDKVARAGAILATNTSYLDVDEIAAATARPEDVIGLHFFSPANIMRLLEVVRGAKTADDVLATALKLSRRIGKIPVVAGVAFGFIGNRMLHIRREAANELLLQGVSPYQIDRVLEDFGMPMGPFRMSDLAGLDIGWSAETSRGETLRDRLCEAGRRGQKSGAGFYDYDEKRRASPSPLVEEMVAALAGEKGRAAAVLDDDAIFARLTWPMIAEAYRILEEGKAIRASDIDIVWLNGYGWPAWTGGPMYHARQIGEARVVAELDAMGLGDRVPETLRAAAQTAV